MDAARLHALASVGELVEVLRSALATETSVPARLHYPLQPSSPSPELLIMPAWRPGSATGVKLLTAYPQNGKLGRATLQGAYALFSGEDGRLLSLLDGPALTQLRTAAVSALAAELMAPRTARTLLIVGGGALAPFMAEGHASIRDYASIKVWARDPAKAEALGVELGRRGLAAEPAIDLSSACREADVISVVTSATSPLVRGRWLKPQMHLDLVGGFAPAMREADTEAFQDAYVAVDTPEALHTCGDLLRPLEEGALAPQAVERLADLVKGTAKPRLSERSVFKSVGTALADLAAAEWLTALDAQSSTGGAAGAT